MSNLKHQHLTLRSPTRCPRRGSSLYIVVMGVGMIVGVIALTTSAVSRLELRSSGQNERAAQAALAARSGVEYALNWLNRNPGWRNTLTSGVDAQTSGTFSGRFVWRVTDTDGDLADDPRDHAVLRCVGSAEDARAVLEVTIEPAGRGLTCLEAAIHAGGGVDINSNGEIHGTGIVSSNNDIGGSSADVQLDAEAVGTVNGSSFNGDATEGIAPREMPGDHVFDYYLQRGTEIDINSISNSFGKRRIETKLFSRELNPYGDANPHGIYWVDCQNQTVTLHWTRVLGTLLLLNAGPGTEFAGGALYQAEAQNYPTLMVQGDLEIDMNTFLVGHKLIEGWVTNYNPTGIPYLGVSDSDRSDEYPARLEGVVYVTGNVEISDDTTVHGSLVVGGDVIVNRDEKITAEYREYSFNYPPPGFSAGRGVRIVPGTWRRTGQ